MTKLNKKWAAPIRLAVLAGSVVWLGLGCHSGPAPMEQVLSGSEWAAFQTHLAKANGDEAMAWLAMRSEQTGQSIDALREKDRQLPEDHNPFKTTDPDAVRRGALAFRASCVECHGMQANGIGSEGQTLMGIKDFSASSMRTAIAMDPDRLAHWYEKVANGSVSGRVMPDGTPADMPAMRERITREQIWLALTWLGSDASMAKQSPQ